MEQRIARICWNDNQWSRPSGRQGKSRNSESFENNESFGYEEWLFDSRVMPDGYHYAFLEPMSADCHIGKTYDIHIFTIAPNKRKIYLGCLHEVVGITKAEAARVYKVYRANGWLKQMTDDVMRVGGNPKRLGPVMFNIKYRLETAEINLFNPPILRDDSVWHRYNLMYKRGELQFEINKATGLRAVYCLAAH